MHDTGLSTLSEKGVQLVDGLPAVYVERANTIVVADIHLGYEEAMTEEGVYLPRVQLRRAMSLLESLASRYPGARLVIAGDLKHHFSRLLRQERIEIAKLVLKARDLGFRETVLVRGNHDNYAVIVLKGLGVDIVDELDLGGGVLVFHGHKKPDQDYELGIMGHEHPALQVSVGGGRTKFPVFLSVPLEGGGSLLVLPPAGAYQVGNVVTARRSSYLSPIIREKGLVEEAVPIIVDETGLVPLISLGILETLSV